MKPEATGSSAVSYSSMMCEAEEPAASPAPPAPSERASEAQRRADATERLDRHLSNGGAVERVKAGRTGARPGESYEQCINRHRLAGGQNREAMGLVGGCFSGAGTGLLAGLAVTAFVKNPAPALVGAAAGCVAGALLQGGSFGASGLLQGEAEGKVACDGAPGSPEASKPGPAVSSGVSCGDGREVEDASQCTAP